MPKKKLAICAVLTALALAIHTLEPLIPLPFSVPGVKLGLANIITMFALYTLGWREAFGILAARVVLGSFFTGFSSLAYALPGGLCALAVCLALKRFLPQTQLWISGVLAAEAHSLVQLTVGWLITGTPYVLFYLPVMLVACLLTGAITGLCVQLLLKGGDRLWKTYLR